MSSTSSTGRCFSILQEDIKKDLSLDDLAARPAQRVSTFAAVYCTMGIPVARIADATSRKGVLAGSLTVWSVFTALVELPATSGICCSRGWAWGWVRPAAVPPAHAMLSDLYEKEKRGRALAIYSAGIYIGTLLSYWLGGAFADAFNWRVAFVLLGLPGILFAVIVWTTVREPQRGLSGIAPSVGGLTFMQSFAKLWRLRSFRFYSIAAGAGLFVTYGLGNWVPSFLQRTLANGACPKCSACWVCAERIRPTASP